MPIYELTVLKPSGDRETRFTDRQPSIGQTVRIDGRPATVVSRHIDPTNAVADARFVCQLLPLRSREDESDSGGHGSS
jgi:hypothetical protein